MIVILKKIMFFNYKNKYFTKALWLVCFVVMITVSVMSFLYFLVKNNEEQILYFVFEKEEQQLPVYEDANQYPLVNPANLSSQAEILINTAYAEPTKSFDKSKIDQAKLLVSRAIEQNKYDGKNYYLRGVINEIDGDYEQAKKNYEKSLALDPYNNLAAHVRYINILIELRTKSSKTMMHTAVLCWNFISRQAYKPVGRSAT